MKYMREIVISAILLNIFTAKTIINVKDSRGTQSQFIDKDIHLVNTEKFQNINFLKIGKSCLLKNEIDFINECYSEFKGYNNRWIILIDNVQIIENLLKLGSVFKRSIEAIIIKIIPNYEYYNEIYEYPVFFVTSNIFQKLVETEIRTDKYNSFIEISNEIDRKSFSYVFYFWASLTCLISMVLTYVWWYLVNYHFYVNQLTLLQKSVTNFPLMKVTTSSLLLLYIIVNEKSLRIPQSELIKIYIEILLQVIIFVFKTFFFFLIFLVSSGWQIYRSFVTLSEQRNFIFSYILIFFLICIDQILDILYPTNYFSTFSLTEMKNMVIYGSFGLVIFFRVYQSLNLLWIKYNYAVNYLHEYAEAILLKIRILRNISWLVMSYSIVYITSNFLLKYNYQKESLLKIIVLEIVDNVMLIVFLIIIRARNFPQNFSLFLFESLEINTGQELGFFIHRVLLPPISNLKSKEGFNHQISKLTKEKEIENGYVVVVNPLFENKNNKNEIILVDKVSIAYI